MQVWDRKETGGEKDPREKTPNARYDGEEVSSFMITSHVLLQSIFSYASISTLHPRQRVIR